ncbi:AMP-binding domain-containing protein [Burkholderia multivorans]
MTSVSTVHGSAGRAAGDGTVRFPADAHARIAHWADTRPQALALLHKQRGRWGALRWRDVPSRVDALRRGLETHGFGRRSRLAVCGALTPDLILIGLAAHRAGAEVVRIDREVHGGALRNALDAVAPSHAFVDDRKTVAAWFASGYAPAAPVTLYSAHRVARGGAAWNLVASSALAGPAGGAVSALAAGSLRGRLARHRILWVEEGTEWPDGLDAAVAAWLDAGAVLAAPEVGASSARDRHEIQPDRIVASRSRERELQASLQGWLPAEGTWQRGLTDRASARPDAPIARWLQSRVARLHGLPRAADDDAAPAWPAREEAA